MRRKLSKEEMQLAIALLVILFLFWIAIHLLIVPVLLLTVLHLFGISLTYLQTLAIWLLTLFIGKFLRHLFKKSS